MKNNIIQNTSPILKKNHEIWWYSGNTLIHVIGTTIFVTTGMNHAGLICLISKALFTYSRKISRVKMRLALAHTIQRTFDTLVAMVKKAILTISKPFGNAGKKFILTGCKNSFFTSWGKYINFKRYSTLTAAIIAMVIYSTITLIPPNPYISSIFCNTIVSPPNHKIGAKKEIGKNFSLIQFFMVFFIKYKNLKIQVRTLFLVV